MKKLLLFLVKKNIIRFFDFYFSNVIAKKSEPELMFYASCVSYFTWMGNICLPLDYFDKRFVFLGKNKKLINRFWKLLNYDKQLWLKKVSYSHSMTKDPDKKIAPIVIQNDSIYLYSMWKSEKKILNFLNEKDRYTHIDIKKIKKIFRILFYKKENEEKKIAILLGLINRITFIMGGPGTGKTTLIAQFIISLSMFFKKEVNIRLASTTGKSTIKMSFSLKEALRKLQDERKIDTETKKFCFNISTLHSLVRMKEKFSKPYYNKNRKLLLDVLIIDESSMIDVNMFCNIIDAIPKQSKIIFLGDCNQLPPVGSGSVFKDVFSYYKNGYSIQVIKIIKKMLHVIPKVLENNRNYNNISNKIAFLETSFRYQNGSNIHTFEKSILQNNSYMINKILKNYFENISFFQINNEIDYKCMLKKIVNCYLDYFRSIYNNSSTKKIIKSFKKHQVLCTSNLGDFGTTILNKNIEFFIHKKNILNIKKTNNYKLNEWYVGKPIIITKNCKLLNVFKEDVGIVLRDKEKKLVANFLLPNYKIKKIPCSIINNYKVAWSISVHRSQGSEYESVSFVTPNYNTYNLNRNIIYTAVTRAKNKIYIYGNKNTLINSIKISIKRISNIIYNKNHVFHN